MKKFSNMKKLIIYILSKAGFQVIKKSKVNFTIREFQYELITPFADYAPWLQDAAFQEIYLQTKPYTLVDIYRCYELWQLVENIHFINSEAAFLEVGVWRGGTSRIIGERLKLLNSTRTLYMADTFSGVVKASESDNYYKGGEHADTALETVENIMKYTYENYKILKGIFPNDTEAMINTEEKFGFCHIDVDVYQSAKEIVEWIWGRMIIGGVIIFDDYGFHTCTGVTKYVNEQKNKSDRSFIYNLNGHAILTKIK